MTREHHPVAALFPLLDDEELKELAHDIAARGLVQPIVLDAEGRVLDGRNRLAACELASVEPEFTTYTGDDPGGYALAVNIARRHLSKGQQAMIAARAAFVSNTSQEEAAIIAGTSRARVSYAAAVLRHAPELADAVVSGALGLDAAYKEARDRKDSARAQTDRLAMLRAEAPELADKVVDGELTLDGAWAEQRARVEEADRQRRVATNLLCQSVVTVAQLLGGDTGEKYDPLKAADGRHVTRRVLRDARAAIDELLDVWEERDLP